LGRLGLEQLESRVVLDSTVVFNEIMYHPTGSDAAAEWIELHNQMAVDMDLSGWYLDGGVEFRFADGTIISGGGYLVVAASPSELEASAGLSGVPGPFSGRLANEGELLQLRNNNDRIMDEIEYGDDAPWPVGPDGSGASLAKTDPNSATMQPENWATSPSVGGTTGAPNASRPEEGRFQPLISAGATARLFVPLDHRLGDGWRSPVFDDSAWLQGPIGAGYDMSQRDYASMVLGDNPIGYWRFEEPAEADTAMDSSGHGRDGAYVAGVSPGSAGAPGIGGYSATFDGTSGFVDLPGS
jgi:hypothetical protein